MRRSLRTRIFIILLLGAVWLGVSSVLISAWSTLQLRDQTISASSQIIRRQADLYLSRTAADRARSMSQAFDAAQQLALASGKFLSHSPSDTSTVAAASDILAKFYLNSTSELDANLDALLPALARSLPEVVRASYVSANGDIKTFPELPATARDNWNPQQEWVYNHALPRHGPLITTAWSTVRETPDGTTFSVLAPVYKKSNFSGAVSIDLSLARLSSTLDRLDIASNGFAFLADNQGQLLTTSRRGQKLLGLHTTTPTVTLGVLRPELALALNDMSAGREGSRRVMIDGREYLLSYSPIPALGWSLGMAAPVDEMTAGVVESTNRIQDLTWKTNALGLSAIIGTLVIMGFVLSLVLSRQFVRPLATLTSAARAVAAGELPTVSLRSEDELGKLATAFNTMTTAIRTSRAETQATNERLELAVSERTADLEQAVARMEQLYSEQQTLLKVLNDVSTPVIPVAKGALVMPLIGQLTAERARIATSNLLSRLEREHARTVLLDVTGLPIIDTETAHALLETVAASRLLGADVILVGVTPEVAQTIVSLGINLGNLRTALDVQTAIESL